MLKCSRFPTAVAGFALAALGGMTSLATATPDGRWLEFGAPSRMGHVAIYDPAGDRMLILSGTNGTSYRNDVWSLGFSPGPSWTKIEVQGSPPAAREGTAGIFDPVRRRVVIFGGIVGSSLVNDVWELSLTGAPTWSPISPAGTPPSPRANHSAIYDSARDRMIVFGGDQTGGETNDVWALSLSGTPTWTLLSPSGTPPAARRHHGAIYDAAADRMLVFGGLDQDVYYDDTWSLSLAGPPAWSHLGTGGTPPPGYSQPSVIYDAPRGRMIASAGSAAFQRVWELTLDANPTWTERTPAVPGPVGRGAHSAVFDPSRDLMVLYGGDDVSIFSDTWTLSLDGTWVWTPVIVPVRPSARVSHSAVLDPVMNRMVVFGGRDAYGPRNDVWTLTLGTVPVWTAIDPAAPGGAPAPRGDAAAIYDPVRNRMILFGGSSDYFTGHFDDTWVLSLDASPTWTRLVPPSAGRPAARKRAAAAYDPVGDRMIIYGGSNSSSSARGDTWALSLGPNPEWVQLIPTTFNPPALDGPKMVYDTDENRMVMFGGWRATNPIGYTNTTWVLSLGDAPDWYPMTAGSPPPARYLHGLTYDSSRDRLLVLDGAGALGRLDDVYARTLDGSSSWVPLAPLGGSPGARQAHTAIYDPDLDRLVMFGGYWDVALADTWFLSFRDEEAPQAASLTGASLESGEVHLEWQGREPYQPDAHVYRKPEGGGWERIGTVSPDGANRLALVDANPPAGPTCRYMLGFTADPGEQYAGEVEVVLSTTGVAGSSAAALALRSARVAGRAVEVSFSLADPSPARLDLFDLAGRRVASSDVASFGPGEHRATLTPEWAPAAGIYWVRLSQGRSSRLLKAALLR